MANYYLIPMDYMEFDFIKLADEYRKNGEIKWQVTGTPVYNRRTESWEIKKDAKLPHKIKCGDIVYFYIFGIISQSGNDKARILLRGVVTKEPAPMKYKEMNLPKPKEEMDDKVGIGFSIGEITTLNKEELENDFCYSREALWKDYDQDHPQGLYWPNQKDKNLKDPLIKDLEKSFKKSGFEREIAVLINHFDRACYFRGKTGTKNDHKTFKRRNGTDYFEGHHFIQQHAGEKIEGLEKIIKAEANLVWLCSNCHNQLHYGRPEDINRMIELLWEDENIKKLLEENHFQELIGAEDEEDALDWVKGVYRSNIEKEKDNV